MSSSIVDPEGLVATGVWIVTVAEGTAVLSGMAVSPPGADPVAVGVTATLQSRLAGITTYSSTAAAITAVRAQMVTTSTAAYTEQEALNAGSLNGGGAGAGAPPHQHCHRRYRCRLSRRSSSRRSLLPPLAAARSRS